MMITKIRFFYMWQYVNNTDPFSTHPGYKNKMLHIVMMGAAEYPSWQNITYGPNHFFLDKKGLTTNQNILA